MLEDKFSFRIKPVINKANGQVNISIPKKALPKVLAKNPNLAKIFKIKFEGWE